jgi:arginine repressor
MSNACKRRVTQSTISKLIHEVYVYPIRLSMHEKMFQSYKQGRATLVSGRTPVKRQILSVHVYDKIPS